jgi:hypothetical protein
VAGVALEGALQPIAQAGFSYVQPKGENHCVMRTVIA